VLSTIIYDCDVLTVNTKGKTQIHGSLKKKSVQDDVIRGTIKVFLTLSGRSPEPTPTKPNDLLGCCLKQRLSNRPQMPPPSRHVGSGGSYLYSSRLLNLGFEPVRASPARGGSGRGSREGKKAPGRGSSGGLACKASRATRSGKLCGHVGRWRVLPHSVLCDAVRTNGQRLPPLAHCPSWCSARLLQGSLAAVQLCALWWCVLLPPTVSTSRGGLHRRFGVAAKAHLVRGHISSSVTGNGSFGPSTWIRQVC